MRYPWAAGFAALAGELQAVVPSPGADVVEREVDEGADRGGDGASVPSVSHHPPVVIAAVGSRSTKNAAIPVRTMLAGSLSASRLAVAGMQEERPMPEEGLEPPTRGL
jgi:hypothetical protein